MKLKAPQQAIPKAQLMENEITEADRQARRELIELEQQFILEEPFFQATKIFLLNSGRWQGQFYSLW